MSDMTEFEKHLIEKRDNYKQKLQCIREVLDGFNAFEGYTPKQYSESLQKINEILEEVNL